MVEVAKGKIYWVAGVASLAGVFLLGTALWMLVQGGPERSWAEVVTFGLIGIGALVVAWGWVQAARFTRASAEGIELYYLGRGRRSLKWRDVAAADRLINQCFFVDRAGETYGVFLWYFRDPEGFVRVARQGFPAGVKLKGF